MVVHIIQECMECGEDWKWNNVSVNVESLYSTLEIIQQRRRNEGSVLSLLFAWHNPSRFNSSTMH